jgi:hypothetical protein
MCVESILSLSKRLSSTSSLPTCIYGKIFAESVLQQIWEVVITLTTGVLLSPTGRSFHTLVATVPFVVVFELFGGTAASVGVVNELPGDIAMSVAPVLNVFAPKLGGRGFAMFVAI